MKSKLTLGIGTNNSAYDVSSSGGTAWANMVNVVRTHNHSQGYDAQVYIDGASDIEPGFSSATNADNWRKDTPMPTKAPISTMVLPMAAPRTHRIMVHVTMDGISITSGM